MTIISEDAPSALHRSPLDLPFVDIGPTGLLQLLQVDLANGVWVVRNRFPAAGTTLQTHRHTGHVHAFTQSGSWHYLESPEAQNCAGSYLFEPAGSTHTLHVPAGDEETEVCFTISGANLNLAADGTIESVLDAPGILAAYRALCEAQHGVADAPVVVVGG